MNILELVKSRAMFGGGGGGEVVLQEKTVDATENGTVEVTPDDGYDGLSKATVNVDVEIPEAVAKQVTQDELNFAGGAIALTPDSGKVFSGVSIPVPDNLEAGNIAEGVNIAGIVGTLAAGSGGGGNVKIAVGTYTHDANYATKLIHNLGVVPDIIIVIPDGSQTTNTDDTSGMAIQFSSAMVNKFPSLPAETRVYFNGGAMLSEKDDNGLDVKYKGCIYTSMDAPENQFFIKKGFMSGVWIAIAGLT